VVGKSELADGTVNVNQRGTEEKRTVTVDAFGDELATAILEKR
jgi:threonyl-tRNA synthetase